MAEEAATAGATPLLGDLPDEIVTWEILVRLEPKSLLRCRAVSRAWRCATSTRGFLLANHSRQPTLPILSNVKCIAGVMYHDILAFDHRAASNAQLHTVARLDRFFHPSASCDGLLVLSKHGNMNGSSSCHSICNPSTREHGFLRSPPWDFSILGMYHHRPTGEYRLLLRRSYMVSPTDRMGSYVLLLQLVSHWPPPRHVGREETSSGCIGVPALMHDCLHWYASESKLIKVFDTIAESFRQMRVPVVRIDLRLFEMDDTLAIHSTNIYTGAIDIWVLKDHQGEIWDFKYSIELPIAEISKFERGDEPWGADVVSGGGDVLLLVNVGGYLLHVNSDGKLIDYSYNDYEWPSMYTCRLKPSLVHHTLFPALEGYAVNASPFI